MLQGQQGTGARTTVNPSLPSNPQILHAGEAGDPGVSHGAALAASTLARLCAGGQWQGQGCSHPSSGKPWQSRPLVAGFMLPAPACICNGI